MKLVDEGENRLCKCIVEYDDLEVGLFMNTSEPTESAVLADIIEPAGNGYAKKTLSKLLWSVPNDLASYAKQTFTATGNWGNIYGYFICGYKNDATKKLMFVELFDDGPYNIAIAGQYVEVTPLLRVA